MASFDAYADGERIYWTISGLSNPFNTTYYLYAGVYGSACSFGQVNEPSPRYDGVSAPTSGSNNYVSDSWGVSYGDSYTLYPAVRAKNGLWYPAGSSVYVEVEASGRPNNWVWVSNVSSGATINITANSWNSFTARINEFRAYKGMSNYSFTTISSGWLIYAYIVNQAVFAITQMSPPLSAPSSVNSGSSITAYFFNRLKDSLNSIQ